MFQHRDQFLVPQLKRRSRQEEHPLKDAFERTSNHLYIAVRTTILKQRRLLRGRVFEMVGFVEDQQR